MKRLLLDTSILVRERDTNDPKHTETVACIRLLWQTHWTLCLTTQSLIEYWSVATRPAEARGGLGLTPEEAEVDIQYFLTLHEFVEEPPGLFDFWRALVNRFRVSGKQVWDARLVALLEAAGIKHLLTFNKGDFNRYSSVIQVWTPEEVELLTALEQ